MPEAEELLAVTCQTAVVVTHRLDMPAVSRQWDADKEASGL